ncbi:MAG: ABC transporter permease [Gammaproteobacteria bacterium]|nr:ABC transporter permease [Gammaproteobacteria bacterium]
MADINRPPLVASLESVGRGTLFVIEEFGYYLALTIESFYWLLVGPFRKQPVKLTAILQQMVTVGLAATPIVFVLSFAVGVMLAIQGIYQLQKFGAESRVVVGIAFAITREFGPLITSILVAGRTGSALAARIGTMQVNQEIDALRVMGINPVRYLVAPSLLAMLIMVPTLTVFADFAGLLGGALYCNLELGLGYAAFWDQAVNNLTTNDVWQGLSKSVVFAIIITLVGVSNGFIVSGGAEGVGHSTTRSVVISISYIVLADMVFTFFLNR